ncbi:hypothetical protein K505DRAFT_69357 [Melanomma pulvis-pyrius CBS 109.77]|uniref:Uncharacterized protein n=1 Tax=Melanomma pulvis-pyrius CBS 109.77 TaxID=1314802 RepID=A0A6A6X3T9_9PLEO|nr:hypothetical protein K505DRAFT_69357 [Melanomma pulvis-pyrius CBS 109.77]
MARRVPSRCSLVSNPQGWKNSLPPPSVARVTKVGVGVKAVYLWIARLRVLGTKHHGTAVLGRCSCVDLKGEGRITSGVVFENRGVRFARRITSLNRVLSSDSWFRNDCASWFSQQVLRSQCLFWHVAREPITASVMTTPYPTSTVRWPRIPTMPSCDEFVTSVLVYRLIDGTEIIMSQSEK